MSNFSDLMQGKRVLNEEVDWHVVAKKNNDVILSMLERAKHYAALYEAAGNHTVAADFYEIAKLS